MDVNALPQVNEGFCFSGDEFLQETFTVDDFIKNHRNDISLEQLRQDLSSYLKTCRLALIDTINEDYNDFINLMDDLVGLDTNINNLIEPLENIQNDIKLVEKEFTFLLNEITDKMKQLQLTRLKRKQIESMLNVYRNMQKVENLCDTIENAESETIDISLIERIAIQMEEIVVNLEYNNSGPEVTFSSVDLDSRSKILSERVRRILEKSFTQAISRSEGDKIERLYIIFLLNGQLDVLEKMLILKIRPYLISVISESRLEALGTEKFFTNIKNLLLNQLNVFFYLGNECAVWFINRIWNEVVTTLTIQSPSLFSSGNPDQFHSNYTATFKFLNSLKDDVQINNNGENKLAENCQLDLLTRKFNIQVYFRIRFQEIASRFEYSLKQSYTYQPQEEPKFKIPPLIELLRSINECWSVNDVYLPPLFINFWKLTLQVIARCTVWLSTIQLPDLVIGNVTSSIESSRLKTSLVSTIFSQSEKTITEIEKMYQKTVLPLKPNNFDEKLLKESLDYGLIELARTGLPNIVKLTKECLMNKNLT